MILIFAVDNNWNIGLDGGMLAHIKKDLKRFRELTEGNIVIMGRRTMEAGPNGRPLPNRTNIILTSKDLDFENDYVVKSLDDLDILLKEINKDNSKKVFVTGGQSVVEQLLDKCDEAYITKILKTFDKADTSLPNLDRDDDWKVDWESDIYSEDGLDFKYVNYRRIKK